MNDILQLKGQFQQKSNIGTGGPPSLPKGAYVEVGHLVELQQQLNKLLTMWEEDTLIGGALISVYYYHVVAKSNRISGLLCKGSKIANDSICGSKFYGDNPQQHVFTHYVDLDIIRESIQRLTICIELVNKLYAGKITDENLNEVGKGKYNEKRLAKTNFMKVIVDAYYVEKFAIDRNVDDIEEQAIVTLYKTNIKTVDLLTKLGIDMIEAKTIDETTVRLMPNELAILKEKAPYLIAMKTYDLSKVVLDDVYDCETSILNIKKPINEPVVGVIDTLFYQEVYFKEWVTYYNMVDERIPVDMEDYFHGTAVTSIIVDGPSFNPNLEDGCGNFRVRHFGVATKGKFSSFAILKAIREIVAKNKDIKVWNLSLGSALEINRNFISPEAAELDKIQSEYDVIFIVAGTNKGKSNKKEMRIGAPADSLNSLVVNSVDFNNQPSSYHRVGPVLSFFHKPDVSYYGGDYSEKIRVCSPTGEAYVTGTSFAAPWITRKVAYLIYNMGFTREVAKALIIDSAAGWNRKDDTTHRIGYGVVPKRIEDIVQTKDDEIRFIMTGSSEAYETYTYNIPIPSENDKHPFFARATLCYFPKTARNQGVDYTSTEMDIHFGRIREKDGNPEIKSINANKQGDTGFYLIPEENARKLYRKWDNIKLISDEIKNGSRPRKKYGVGLWGLSIKTKERLEPKNGKGMQFGVVVTLKEMNGKNRIDDFIKMCMVRGWIVNRIDVHNQLEVFNRAEEELDFDE